MIYKERSNEYEMRHNGKKIVLCPISSMIVRSMVNKQGKRKNVTMLTTEREVIMDHLCNAPVYTLLEFSQPFEVECEESGVERVNDNAY